MRVYFCSFWVSWCDVWCFLGADTQKKKKKKGNGTRSGRVTAEINSKFVCEVDLLPINSTPTKIRNMNGLHIHL